jgi:hypothetical protein
MTISRKNAAETAEFSSDLVTIARSEAHIPVKWADTLPDTDESEVFFLKCRKYPGMQRLLDQ